MLSLQYMPSSFSFSICSSVSSIWMIFLVGVEEDEDSDLLNFSQMCLGRIEVKSYGKSQKDGKLRGKKGKI